MKIAIIGPIESAMTEHSVGGTEMWTYNFAEALVKRGHDVTLFGAEGSKFSGKFISVCNHDDISDKKIGSLNRLRFAVFSVQEMLEVTQRLADFDLVHVSYYSLHYFLPFSTIIDIPIIETIHGSPLSYDDMEILLKKYTKPFFIFPSKNSFQRWPAPKNHQVINHGIEIKKFPFPDEPREDFYFWMGRLVEQKGVETAIRFARETDSNLIIAGPKNEEQYFKENVEPFLNQKIQYVGELNFEEKINYFKKAKAFLMPIHWDEPFGLVIIEAMACGTPVVAYGRGSMPEIIVHEKTGFLCPPDDFECFKKSLQKIDQMSQDEFSKMSNAARKRAEEKFSFEKMVDQYLEIYTTLIRKK